MRWRGGKGVAGIMERLTATMLLAGAVVLAAASHLGCTGHPDPARPGSATATSSDSPVSPPRAVPGVAMRLPADLAFAANPDAPAPVIFRHETHVETTAPLCTGCHPGTFPILKRGGPVTHADMEAGRSCGACHDGRAAFSAADSDACELCHRASEGPAPAGRAPAAGTAGGRP